MYPYGLGMEKAFQLEFAAAADIFENQIEGVQNPRQFELNLVAGFSMLAGNFEKARTYAELSNPEFVADADPEIDAFNIRNLVRYAFILQNLDEDRRADALLDTGLQVVRTLPRLGLTGHGIRDVQILALQGRTFDALAALRDAIDEGFRGTVASNGWPMSVDPYLDSLRDQPAFQAMIGELDAAVEEMHERVIQAEENGNWDELRSLVEST
jgi:hypothetical protein